MGKGIHRSSKIKNHGNDNENPDKIEYTDAEKAENSRSDFLPPLIYGKESQQRHKHHHLNKSGTFHIHIQRHNCIIVIDKKHAIPGIALIHSRKFSRKAQHPHKTIDKKSLYIGHQIQQYQKSTYTAQKEMIKPQFSPLQDRKDINPYYKQ